jgi:hypothetical protein
MFVFNLNWRSAKKRKTDVGVRKVNICQGRIEMKKGH